MKIIRCGVRDDVNNDIAVLEYRYLEFQLPLNQGLWIFVSTRAVHALLKKTESIPTGVTLGAVGATTKEELARYFPDILIKTSADEGLQALLSDNVSDFDCISVFCSRDGLSRQIAKRYDVAKNIYFIDVYETHAVQFWTEREVQLLREADAIKLSSGRAVEAFFRLWKATPELESKKWTFLSSKKSAQESLKLRGFSWHTELNM